MTVATAQGWNLKIGYVPKFGWLRFQPSCPHGGIPPAWNVPFTDLLRQTGVTSEQLRAHWQERQKPLDFLSDLSTEELCDSAIGDCTGKAVLDIGGYDGRAAAVALRQGASEAIVVDNEQWIHYGWEPPQSRPGVRYWRSDFMSVERNPPFDVVLFFNVIYHCPDPRLALEKLRTITRERLVLCSLVTWDDRPVWYPREPYEVNEDDDTVYWTPSDAGLIKLLKATGWQNIRELGKTTERLVLEATPH